MLRLIGIACLMCCFRLLSAQVPLQPVPGLPTKEIYDLHVDRKGYLWVAHGLGLSRYDGLNFVHFTHPAQVTLRTTDIVEDNQGRIWCHNFSGQVYYVAQGQMRALEAYDYRKENQYPRMALYGSELLITSQYGLFICNTNTLKSRYIHFTQPSSSGTVSLAIINDRAVIYNGQHWYQYHRSEGLQGLAADADVMQGRDNTLSLQPQTLGDTLFLIANPDGMLQKLVLQQGRLRVVAQQGFNDYINAVTTNGTAWVHTRNESITHDGKVRIKAYNLTDVVTGPEGNQWYSSLREGLMVNRRSFAWKLIQFPIDADDYVRSLNVNGGYFFAGTQKGNLYIMAQDSGRPAWQHNLFNGYGSIDFIRYYKDHRFLVGSSVNTYIVNAREKKVENLLPLNAILDVDFEGGNLYLATTNGFYLLPNIDSVLKLPGWTSKAALLPAAVQAQKEKETFLLARPRTRAVRYDKASETLFIAAKDGLQQIDAQGLQPVQIAGQEVFATSLWHRHPRLYVGTVNNGLWIKEGNRWRHFTTANALFSNTILRLKVTGRYLWLFQNTGIQVFDTETDQVLQHIDLPAIEGDNVYDVAEKDGYAYLTTAQGIYKVPMYVSVSRPAPKGFLDYVLVNNKDTLFAGNITLPYDRNDMQFFFSAPAFNDPASLSFRYRLLGTETDWQVTKPGERMLRYSALQPGTYTFEVLAVNKYGLQQPQPMRYSFTVARPWWSTWWFIVAINVMAAAVVFLVIRNRAMQKLRVELIRRNISADLHDDIGATLSSVNIYAALAKSEKIKEPYLELIQQHITDAVTRLDDLVWSINPRNDSMKGLVARMQSTAKPLLEAAGIQCHFEYDPKVLAHKLNLSDKRHFYLLFKEMLNNVVKHAGCAHCNIYLEVKHGRLHLTVSDDGVGFDEQQADGNRHGLRNMYTRAEKLKGKLNIKSAEQEGCTIEVVI